MMLCLPVVDRSLAEEKAPKHGLINPFFAFDNGTGRGKLTPQVQAKMLKELGYAGIGYTGAGDIPEMLEALDRQGLKMFSIYVGAKIGDGGPTYDPDLAEGIKALKGRDTLIWLFITGKAPDGDDQAVRVVREIADLAKASGLRVALYPHVGFHVARVEDALRIVGKVERKNVGVSFNLCHWLKLDDEKNMKPLIKAAMPHLFLVSINGADGGDTKQMNWDRLIQTLDRGTFDVYGFLKTLRNHGYHGPIGLQCYGVKGDARKNLERSMSAWRILVSRMAQPDRNKEPVPDIRAEGFVSLFDGKTLDGWRRVNGSARYHVDGGSVVGVCDPKSRVNTFLRTEKVFRDFIFTAQVKFDVLGNSGIQFRSNQRDGNGRVHGYQCEICQNLGRRWSGGIYDEARRGWLYKLNGEENARARQAFNYDGWNTFVIKAQGRRLQTWVNGVPCADFVDMDDEHFTPEGFIALQVHSGKQGTIRWRDIGLKVLGQKGGKKATGARTREDE
jgi:sugar phosphate isomerase/epimerase